MFHEHFDSCDKDTLRGAECHVIPVEPIQESEKEFEGEGESISLQYTESDNKTVYVSNGYYCEECRVVYDFFSGAEDIFVLSFVPRLPRKIVSSSFNCNGYTFQPAILPPYPFEVASEEITSYFSNEGELRRDINIRPGLEAARKSKE